MTDTRTITEAQLAAALRQAGHPIVERLLAATFAALPEQPALDAAEPAMALLRALVEASDWPTSKEEVLRFNDALAAARRFLEGLP